MQLQCRVFCSQTVLNIPQSWDEIILIETSVAQYNLLISLSFIQVCTSHLNCILDQDWLRTKRKIMPICTHLKLIFSVSSEKNSTFNRWMWKQISNVKLCTAKHPNELTHFQWRGTFIQKSIYIYIAPIFFQLAFNLERSWARGKWCSLKAVKK